MYLTLSCCLPAMLVLLLCCLACTHRSCWCCGLCDGTLNTDQLKAMFTSGSDQQPLTA